VIGAAALIGGRDKSDEVVSAGEWAQSVCGAVGVWRGELEGIVDDVRNSGSTAVAGSEEPQSETPQGRSTFVRAGLESAVQATETLVEGIDNAGIPETSGGAEAARLVSDWADSTQDDFEEAEDSLDEEADSLEEAIEQFTEAAGAIGAALVGGVRTIAEVAALDPELARALRESSTCEELREETS
jgi:hypothetical protein